MKKHALTLGLLALLSVGSFAGDQKGDGKGGGDFTGTITAVEVTRDSFTVANADGRVKMFTVSPEKKSQLSVGQKVTVSYSDAYYWPLHTSNISISDK